MKALGNKSLSAILATGINILWWMEWIGCGLLIAETILSGIIRKGYVIKIPVTYDELTLRQVHPSNTDFPLGILNITNGDLALGVNATFKNESLVIIGIIIISAVALLITYQLKMIFSNFRKNLPFNELNIPRVRNIALVFISFSIIQWLGGIALNQMLNTNLKWGRMELTQSFNFSYLLIGLALYIVAEIFKMGLLLEEEKALTI